MAFARDGKVACLAGMLYLLQALAAHGAEDGAAPSTPAEMWRHAVSLVQAGEPGTAIPILDRLVTAAPDAASIRLELGLAYFLEEDDRRARYHIRRALAGDLSAAETRGAEGLLQRIEDRRSWTARFGLALVPQTNAGRRTEEETVHIGGLPFRLSETAEPGIGIAPSLSFGYRPQLRDNLRGRAVVSFSGTLYRQSALNDYSLRGELGLTRHGDAVREVGAGVMATQRWVGNRRYWHEAGLYVTATVRPSTSTRLVLRGERLERRARDRPGLDGSVTNFSLGAEHVLTPRLALFARVHGRRTRVAADHQSGLALGAGAGITHLLDGGWRTTLRADVTRDRRDGPTPLFGTVRRDIDLRVSAQLLNRRLHWRGFAPAVELVHERRRSTISIESYTNTYLSLGVEREF